jgi:hypothetical protein
MQIHNIWTTQTLHIYLEYEVHDAGASAIHHTNQREEKEETAGQASKPQILNSTLVLLRRRFTKGIQS